MGKNQRRICDNLGVVHGPSSSRFRAVCGSEPGPLGDRDLGCSCQKRTTAHEAFSLSRKAKNWPWDYAKPIQQVVASLSVTFLANCCRSFVNDSLQFAVFMAMKQCIV